MTPAECHYEFKLGMDRVDKASAEDFNLAEIDWLINQAQIIFIKQRYDALSNKKGRGFENSQKRIDDLSTVHIQFPLQPYITGIFTDGVVELDLDNLAFPYLFLTSASAIVKKTNCEIDVPLKFSQTDDLRSILRDPFNNASEEFIPYNFGRSSNGTPAIYVYPGQYNISKFKISYITLPPRFSIGNYTYIDSTPSVYQGLITPEHTHTEIVDIALQLAATNIESPEYISLKNSKILIQE